MIVTITDGVTRCLLEDDVNMPEACSVLDGLPSRASSIEPVLEGRFKGWWKVDLSPLTAVDSQFLACSLLSLFKTRSAAISAEVEWLRANFLGV